MDLKTASSSCWILPPPIACLVSLSCGWTRATTAKTRAHIGCKRCDGVDGAEIVRHPPKLVGEEVMKKWVRELTKEGVKLDREKMQEEPKGPRAFLAKRWIVERTFSWLSQNRRMSKDYEKLPESAEAFIYVAMSRLMARRLARS